MLKWLWLSLVVIVLDQATKIVIFFNMAEDAGFEVLSFFNIVHVQNPGAAFSFLSTAGGWQRWLFAVLAIGISVFIVHWIKKLKDNEKYTALGLSLVLGGALGNLIDRVYLGKVIDFLDFHIGPNHWPAFNVADIAISIGVVALIILSFFDNEGAKGKEAD